MHNRLASLGVVSLAAFVVASETASLAQTSAVTALARARADAVCVRVYRLHHIDAQSAGNLIVRTLRDVSVAVDRDRNVLSVLGTLGRQRRIAGALAQLDVAPRTLADAADAGRPFEVVSLRAVLPGPSGVQSTSATEIAQTISDALSQSAPDLHVTVPTTTPTKLILTGSGRSIQIAKALIAELDVAQPLVVFDTQILEIDEAIARNIGLQLSQPVVSTTIAENTAPLAADGTPSSLGFQRFGRTPLSLGVQLNLLVQNGSARILSNPRITTVSGQAATIRAGDSIAILTTAGGGVGTVATTQLQTFQTGVTLDITPIVNVDNFISVTLHPTVNSLSGILNGIPQISTRETQTTVTLKEDQTLVIGGLIEDNTNRTETKIPLLGDLPLIGRLFRNATLNRTRNELVVTVTPHIALPGSAVPPAPSSVGTPAPIPLPTLPPATTLPAASPQTRAGSTPRAAAARAGPALRVAAQGPRRVAPALQLPGARTHSASAASVASASAATNAFTYGHPPANNYAAQGDPVAIYFATLSPTVVRNGQSISIAAITSTNVTKLSVGYGSFATQIGQSTPGQWQSTFNFNAGSAGIGTTRVSLTLTATRLDGASASIAIPVSIVP